MTHVFNFYVVKHINFYSFFYLFDPFYIVFLTTMHYNF